MGCNSRDPSKPRGSNRDWAEYRKIVGMINGDLEPTKKRDLTRRQAFLLLVLGRLDRICEQIDRPKPKKSAIDLISLIEIADEWIDTIGEAIEDAFRMLAAIDGEIPGSRLEEVITDWTGKPLSRRQIRRICDSAGVKFGTKRTYNPNQLQKIYKRVVTR